MCIGSFGSHCNGAKSIAQSDVKKMHCAMTNGIGRASEGTDGPTRATPRDVAMHRVRASIRRGC